MLGLKLRTAVDGGASSDSGHVPGEGCPALPPHGLTAQDLKTSRRSSPPRWAEHACAAAPSARWCRGISADIVAVPLDDIGPASAHHDPLAALMFCHAPCLHDSSVNGRAAMRDGRLATLERRC